MKSYSIALVLVNLTACSSTFLVRPTLASEPVAPGGKEPIQTTTVLPVPQIMPAPPRADSDWHLRRMEVRERRAKEEYRKRAFPLEQIPPGAMARAWAQIQEAERHSPRGIGPSSALWYALGPAPINTTQNGLFQPVSGRVAVVAVDPSNSSHWLIGGAQGGIWETTDQGAHWQARTDDQASLAMGAIAFAPSKPQWVYAGTGEANFSGDSFAGQGLLFSRNGGTGWQMLNTNFAETSFSHIVVDPTTPLNVAASTVSGIAGMVSTDNDLPPNAPPTGVFVSSNGGTNFIQVLTGDATALAMDPSRFNRQYAGLGEIDGAPTNGIYRTTNGWVSHELISGPWTTLTTPTNMGRVALAVSPVDTSTLYVGIAYPENSPFGLVGIWRTRNAWSPAPTWTALTTPSVGPYSWYTFELIADATDASTLYLAEITVQQYQSGFWNDIGINTHSDNHAMAWVPWSGGSWRLLLGNDGGAWLSSSYPPDGNWSDLNKTLSLTQIYKGAVAPLSNEAAVLAGTQDNGTVASTGTLAWNGLMGGDGGDCAVAASDPANYWALSFETYGGINLFRTVDAGTNYENVSFGIDPDNAPFFVHFEKSPHNDNLFIAGTAQLWRCTNFFSATTPVWYSNSPILLNSTGGPVYVSAMAFAPSDKTGLIYAFGTENGLLRITADGGGSWHKLDPGNQVPSRFVTGLAFNPIDTNMIYVTLSGFDEGTPLHPGHLFRTTNAFAATPTWVNLSPPIDLPNDCLAIDPLDSNTILVGTDAGVWSTPNGGLNWSHQGPSSGMPNLAVFDLRMNSVGRPIAFTHGRGAFTYAQPVPIPVLEGTYPLPIEIACLTCPPIEWINPGDLVELQVTLQNILPVDTVNLIGTILPSAEITPINGSQNFGVLVGQGAAVTRQFSLQAHVTGNGAGLAPPGTCGGAGQFVMQLEDGGNDLGQVTVPFHFGVAGYPLREDFNEVAPPALPRGWASEASGADLRWTSSTNWPANAVHPEAPDEPVDQLPPFSGPPVFSAFTPDAAGSGESFLLSPVFTAVSPQAQVFFRQAFVMTNGYDGGILEISLGTQGFVEITQAGGSFAEGGYNSLLNQSNPLGPRAAWSGNSGGWFPVVVGLPPAAAGFPVQFRWRLATVRGLAGGGWFLNSVVVTDPQCLPPVSNPVILNPAVRGNVFSFAIDTVATRTYLIESKTNVTDPTWSIIQSLAGNGSRQTFTIPVGTNGQAFFRFQVP
jgi:hypothetical protein